MSKHRSTTAPSRQLLALAAWLLLSIAAAAVGAVASLDSAAFYRQLARPGWAPPAWLFAPVWSVLYVLIGSAAWLAWRVRRVRDALPAFCLFFAQLAANALWTWLFFAWHRGALAFAEMAVLWALIAGNVIAFWRLRPLAGMLLLPYLAWVSFASVLAYAMWQRNPQLLG